MLRETFTGQPDLLQSNFFCHDKSRGRRAAAAHIKWLASEFQRFPSQPTKIFLANVFHRQLSASASGQHLEEKTSQIFGFGNRSQDWMIRRLFEPTHASR